MLFKGIMIARASGRLGDTVWAHNRGGPYVRTLGNPNPNPASTNQLTARAVYADLIAAWAALAPGQRRGWQRLSDETPQMGRGGAIRPAGAFPCFVRANFPRLYANVTVAIGMSLIEDAPDTASVALNVSDWHWYIDGDDGTLHLHYTTPLPWPMDLSDAGLLVWMSPSLNPTVHFYRSPMTPIAIMPGNYISDEALINHVGTDDPAQHRKLKMRLMMGDGRVSDDYWVDVFNE